MAYHIRRPGDEMVTTPMQNGHFHILDIRVGVTGRHSLDDSNIFDTIRAVRDWLCDGDDDDISREEGSGTLIIGVGNIGTDRSVEPLSMILVAIVIGARYSPVMLDGIKAKSRSS